MAFQVVTNKAQVKARIDGAMQPAIAALTEQVIADSNEFCRVDTGALADSTLRASEPQKGRAVWDTPYARRAYFTGSPSRDKNPSAALMWVEKARSQYGNEWEKLANKQFKEHL